MPRTEQVTPVEIEAFATELMTNGFYIDAVTVKGATMRFAITDVKTQTRYVMRVVCTSVKVRPQHRRTLGDFFRPLGAMPFPR